MKNILYVFAFVSAAFIVSSCSTIPSAAGINGEPGGEASVQSASDSPDSGSVPASSLKSLAVLTALPDKTAFSPEKGFPSENAINRSMYIQPPESEDSLDPVLPQPETPAAEEAVAGADSGPDGNVGNTSETVTSVSDLPVPVPATPAAPAAVEAAGSAPADVSRTPAPAASEPVSSPAAAVTRSAAEQPPADRAESGSAQMAATVPALMEPMSVTLEDGNIAKIPLDGRGWVFLKADININFISKSRSDDGEVFSFSVPGTEEGTLSFQRQNLVSGQLEENDLPVSFRALDGNSVDSTADSTVADAVENDGGESGDSPSAVLAAMNQSVEDGLSAASANRPGSMSAQALEDRAAASLNAGDRSGAVEDLQRIADYFPAYSNLDRVLFTLASVLEEPGDQQDIQTSLRLYRNIVDYHPFSLYETRAEERIRGLQRRFIRVF